MFLMGTRGRIAVLCVIGFLLCFKPSEPFITPYLQHSKHLSHDTVNHSIYPVWTYSYFAFVLPVTMLAEYLSTYKYIVLAGIVSREVTRILLLWANGVPAMQAMQATFGFASASEFVLYSYVFSISSNDDRGIAMGAFRGSMLFGHVSAGLTGQELIDHTSTSLDTLFIISLATVSVGMLLFLVCLPRGSAATKERLPLSKWAATFRHHIRDPYIVMWSTWFWFGNAMLALVLNYQTSLFDELAPDVDDDGYVVAGGRLAASMCAVAAGYLIQRLTLRQSLVPLVVLSAGSAATAVGLAATKQLYTSFALSVLFYGITEAGSVMANVVLARQAPERHYALLFGINTFISVGIQTAVQISVDHTLGDSVRQSMVLFASALVLVLCIIVAEVAAYAWAGSLIEQRYEPLLPTLDQGDSCAYAEE